LVPHLDWCNIACGAHASSPEHMQETVELVQQHGVRIGAHPGYADQENVGRISVAMPSDQITELVCSQVKLLQSMAKVGYIKPHGALYNDMMSDLEVFNAIVTAAKRRQLPLMLLAGDFPIHHALAQQLDIALYHEAFADRAYTPEGQLLPRSESGAVHQDVDLIVKQAQLFLEDPPYQIDTLCLHGDHPASVEAAPQIRQLIDC